jgi:hypothetical protein
LAVKGVIEGVEVKDIVDPPKLGVKIEEPILVLA